MTRRFAGILLVLAAVALAPAGAAARNAVTGLRLAVHPDGVTRLVLDTSVALDARVRLLADPDRVELESDGIDWRIPAAVSHPVGAVAALDYADNRGGRLVVRLRHPATVKAAFPLSPRSGAGWRYVLDLQDASQDEFLAAAETAPHLTAPPWAAPQPQVQPPPAARKPAVVAQVAAVPQMVAPAAPPATPTSIVVMSPMVAAAPQPQPQPQFQPIPVPRPEPQPVAAPAAPAETVPDAGPVPTALVIPAPAAPVPAPRRASAAADHAGRGGGPILSAPMPPPPERPATAIAAVAASPQGEAMAPARPLEPTPVAATVPAPIPTPALAPKPRHGDGKPVVVLDPGHGGVDPGATGISGTHEKVITLAMAHELKRQLERTGRFHVRLTRDGDVFVPLHERVAIARRDGADLFISLHADVVKDPGIRGLSVYTLSQTASDAEAQALADEENKADLIAGIDLSHESADVANILIDLAQRETMNRSAVFAGDIVEELGQETTLLTNTHRFAGFAVLKGPDVPAVLIETGYLSNQVEERELRTAEYRAKLARAISRAVEDFFRQDARAVRP